MWFFVIIIALLIPLIAVILDSQLGRALAKRLEGDQLAPGDEGMGTRLLALESEVERLTEDIRRLEEQAEFMHQLLEGRNQEEQDALPSGEDRV